MDFTKAKYEQLLFALTRQGYTFQTFSEFLNKPATKVVILRHDVDLLPQNSLRFAQTQSKMSIKGSYYFRAVPESWDEAVIKKIQALGHEVGYHYENMDTCRGEVDLAWNDFQHHLGRLRALVEVETICMHGSPRSKFDNRDLWKKYDYRQLDIAGEPYFDMDFDQVFYLTDTGRRWDGWKSSVRDKVPQQEEWIRQNLIFHATDDLIRAIDQEGLPARIMFTFHPQRWHHNPLPWLKELVLQNIKNQVKRFLVNAS